MIGFREKKYWLKENWLKKMWTSPNKKTRLVNVKHENWYESNDFGLWVDAINFPLKFFFCSAHKRTETTKMLLTIAKSGEEAIACSQYVLQFVGAKRSVKEKITRNNVNRVWILRVYYSDECTYLVQVFFQWFELSQHIHTRTVVVLLLMRLQNNYFFFPTFT